MPFVNGRWIAETPAQLRTAPADLRGNRLRRRPARPANAAGATGTEVSSPAVLLVLLSVVVGVVMLLGLAGSQHSDKRRPTAPPWPEGSTKDSDRIAEVPAGVRGKTGRPKTPRAELPTGHPAAANAGPSGPAEVVSARRVAESSIARHRRPVERAGEGWPGVRPVLTPVRGPQASLLPIADAKLQPQAEASACRPVTTPRLCLVCVTHRNRRPILRVPGVTSTICYYCAFHRCWHQAHYCATCRGHHVCGSPCYVVEYRSRGDAGGRPFGR
jgi:hypothetical protein